jgi:hypothetical protein
VLPALLLLTLLLLLSFLFFRSEHAPPPGMNAAINSTVTITLGETPDIFFIVAILSGSLFVVLLRPGRPDPSQA